MSARMYIMHYQVNNSKITIKGNFTVEAYDVGEAIDKTKEVLKTIFVPDVRIIILDVVSIK